MSLQSRLSELVTAIGADIKTLKNSAHKSAASIALQTVSSNSDVYLTGSAVTVPAGKIQAGTTYRCRFNVVKTAAGTQAPVVSVRVGTAGTTADTARASLTFAAQTAVADEGMFEVIATFRSSGATAVIQAVGNLLHRLVTTGLNVTGIFTSVLNTGASFDATTATKIGLALNISTSASWAINVVSAELINVAP